MRTTVPPGGLNVVIFPAEGVHFSTFPTQFWHERWRHIPHNHEKTTRHIPRPLGAHGFRPRIQRRLFTFLAHDPPTPTPPTRRGLKTASKFTPQKHSTALKSAI